VKVNVVLYATLRQYAPDGKGNAFELELKLKATAAVVCKILGMSDDIEAVILVNGRHATVDTYLSEDDTVTLYPTIAGG
jgi:molybdopterin converting factor small subunit